MKQTKFARTILLLLLTNFLSAQTITTLGTGFSSPRGVLVDGNGDIYATSNTSVKSMDATGGNIVTLATGLTAASDIAKDANGNLYVTDISSGGVKKIDTSGNVTTILTGLAQTTTIVLDSNGDLIFNDYGNKRIKKITTSGGNLVTLGGVFSGNTAFALDVNGNIFIADTAANAIKKMDASGNNLTTVISGITSPRGIVLDPAGNIYVSANNAILKITPTLVTTTITSSISMSFGMDIDSSGNLYVADISNAIKKISASLLSVSGTTKNTSFSISPNPAKDFVFLNGISKGSEVNIYDAIGNLVYKTKAESNSINVNTSMFQNGFYLVKIGNETSKLIISK